MTLATERALRAVGWVLLVVTALLVAIAIYEIGLFVSCGNGCCAPGR